MDGQGMQLSKRTVQVKLGRVLHEILALESLRFCFQKMIEMVSVEIFESGEEFKSSSMLFNEKEGASFYQKLNPFPALVGSPFAQSPEEAGPRSPVVAPDRSPEREMVQTPSPISDDSKESHYLYGKRNKVRSRFLPMPHISLNWNIIYFVSSNSTHWPIVKWVIFKSDMTLEP